MDRPNGWTLVEVLVCIAIIALVVSVALPSIGGAREMARLAVCKTSMRAIHGAIMSYAASHDFKMMPFAFSQKENGDLPLSGHWGGASQPGDPDAFGRKGVNCVNLWSLVAEDRVSWQALFCPSAAGPLRSGKASFFPCTPRFSSYGLRFPSSADLFHESPSLIRYMNKTLLYIYSWGSGGQSMPVFDGFQVVPQVVPQVRMDRPYRLTDVDSGAGYTFEPARDAILSDAFWRQGFSAPAPAVKGLQTYPVRWAWDHGARFNVLGGGGSVWTADDDGTVHANSVPPGGQLPPKGEHFAGYAEKVWRYFESKR